MTWEARLRQAAYTGPESSARLTFAFEDVSRITKKLGTVFEFPDYSGAYAQDGGRGSRRFPLRCIFSGENCDTEATAFEALLLERGIGVLEHPAYGPVDVVVLGEVARRDALVSEANIVSIEVEFFETADIVFPSNQAHPVAAIEAAAAQFNETSAQKFNKPKTTGFKSKYERLLSRAKTGLQSLAAKQADIQERFDDIETSITAGIDTLVGQPLSLAFQTVQMIQAPARVASLVQDRLDAYRDLAASILQGPASADEQEYDTNDLYASAYCTAATLSAATGSYATRAEAITAAADLFDQFNSLQAWREASGYMDTGETYQALQAAVALTAGYLVQLSFDLDQERSIITDRPQTIINLAAELYGAVDSRLDFLIDTNALTGDEILEIPAGRKIIYYG